MIELDMIYNEVCLQGMKRIPYGSVNSIITSPPYNVGLNYNGFDDNKEYNDYLMWIKEIFNHCYRILSPDGRMCINIGDGKNGAIPTHSDFIQICKSIGFLVLTTIIWNKNTTSKRTAWGSFMSATAPSFPRNFEFILVFTKSKKLQTKGESTISKNDFIKWSNGMWTIKPEIQSKAGHPAAFPVELPTRLIRMLTFKNDIILDPFIGSGTTAIAAMRERRRYIGFELCEEYFKLASRRISAEKSQLNLF